MDLSEYLGKLSGKRIAVVGMGVSNEPLLRLLVRAGLDVTVRDKRELPPIAGAKTVTGPGYLQDITEDVVFRTPGLRPDALSLKPGAVLTSEMEAFFEVCPCPILAVTGSDGKTTTSTILARLLEAAGKKVWLGGNIGRPLLDRAEEMRPADFAVLELSSFQLMTQRKSPHIAVVTNVRPNHLDWHLSLDEYAEAKKNLFRFQAPGDLLVLNADDPGALAMAGEAKGRLRLFGRERRPGEGCWYDGENVYYNGEAVVRRAEIRLPGLHNTENFMAAFCALYEQVGPEVCRRVASSFSGVAHRLEPVRTLNGVCYYNDSIASSPSRTIANLRVFPERRVVLIAGGYDKHIPYDVLGPEICRYVRVLVLTGATAPLIRRAVLAAPGEKPLIVENGDFRGAVLAAVSAAVPGDSVLLSPASASFDRFRNFEERGDAFKEIILGLQEAR